jgi:tetratricopeptide (TPR) repeat protein
LREGAFDEAVSLYGRAIEAAPNGCQAHVLHANRAAAYTRLGRHEEALADAK